MECVHVPLISLVKEIAFQIKFNTNTHYVCECVHDGFFIKKKIIDVVAMEYIK